MLFCHSFFPPNSRVLSVCRWWALLLICAEWANCNMTHPHPFCLHGYRLRRPVLFCVSFFTFYSFEILATFIVFSRRRPLRHERASLQPAANTDTTRRGSHATNNCELQKNINSNEVGSLTRNDGRLLE
jgi:hypothetical protein